MAKKKSVTPAQLEEIKSMAIEGIGPQKIADQYGISVSAVHGYKQRFKSEGVNIPSVRGRQPGVKPSGEIRAVAEHKHPASVRSARQTNITAQNSNTFIINGIPVNITNQAKSVNINKTNDGITFEIKL